MATLEVYSGIEEPSVLAKFRAILDEYRNDVQIIKELIQNADDAEATQMKILYEGRQLNPETPGEKEYRKFFRAPALAVYNDAVFTEDDRLGIRSIYISVKKNDPLKVGRFGLGFKSVFHLTDYPCIITGEYALFLNPMEEDSKKFCTTIKLKDMRQWTKLNFGDVLAPLSGTFGISEDIFDTGYYDGTLFWFPLRQTPSELSDDIYSYNEVSVLLNAFLQDSERSLIFLKTLCQIQLYCNLANEASMQTHTGHNEKVPLTKMNSGRDLPYYTVNIDNDNQTLLQKKKSCLEELKAIGHNIPEHSKTWVFNVTVKLTTVCSNGERKDSKARWLIVNYLKGGSLSETMNRLLDDKQLGYPHIVAVAAPINDDSEYHNKAGHIFCYQPLPLQHDSMTFLPIHINGFFALSQNRRQVSWPDAGENEFIKDKKIEWNMTLVSEILPNAYITLLMEMVKLAAMNSNTPSGVAAVINAIPDLKDVDPNWKVLAEKCVLLCKDKELFYTKADNGKWVTVNDAVFADFRAYPELSKGSQKTVTSLLRKDGINVVEAPGYVVDTFKYFYKDVRCVSHKFLAEHMRTSTTYKQLPSGKRQDLLEFFSQDSSYHYLEGLELVPLADGTFSSFSNDKSLFVEPQEIIELFPGSAGCFVASKLRQKTKLWLSDLVEKGTSCLQPLTSTGAANLVQDVLKNNFDEIHPIKIPSQEVEKWKSWTKQLWDLIQSRFNNTVKDFRWLPIFPYTGEDHYDTATDLELLPLDDLILLLKVVEYRPEIYKVFKLLSVTTVREEFVPDWLSENVRREFLWYPENMGEMLNKVLPECVSYFNENISDPDRGILLDLLSRKIHAELKPDAKKLLRQLYLFRGYDSMTSSKLCSLQEHNVIDSGKNFPVRFPKTYIRVNSEMELSFTQYLDGVIESEFSLVLTAVSQWKQYTNEEVSCLMLWVLSFDEYFGYETLQAKMRDAGFLITEDGKYFKPSELFDPSVRSLQNLFKGKPVFPSDTVCLTENVLSKLRILGLKGINQISSDDIEAVVADVEKMSAKKETFDETKCKALLEVMETRTDIVDKQSIWDRRCILVQRDIVENYPRGIALLNRKSKASALICQPSDIKSATYVSIVGSVKFAIDSKSVPNLSALFQWDKQPDVEDVVHHLFNIVQSYEKRMRSQFENMIVEVYRWLSKQDIHQVKEALNSRFAAVGKTYIWADDEFHTPEEVVVNESDHDIDDLRPLIHKLPLGTSDLKELFLGIGCIQNQSLEMYVHTLGKIKHLSDTEEIKPIESKLLNICREILETIRRCYLNDPGLNKDELFFPVQDETNKLKFQPTKKCTYCESDWVKRMSELDADVYFVHPEVPVSTAKDLGVPSIKQQALSDAIPIQPWGQTEPLTRRLHALLKDGYVDGFSVAKELFQNADDAGANKLWIMYDERENNEYKTHLMSSGMAECQGPAIWVYNDATFSETDFENITKLNGATKENDAGKIGKFGLGFCSVYNITDVPSFLSGHSVVMFDPHMTFLEEALQNDSPGLRINLQHPRKMKAFKDQLYPFEGVFGCAIIDKETPEFSGTLFRLPLRNKGSNISDIVYTSSEVKRLFEKIMELSANMFVFNQNIDELKLFHLPKNAKNPRDATTIYEVTKSSWRLLPKALDPRSCPVVDAVKSKQKRTLKQSPLRLLNENKIEVTQYKNHDFKISTDNSSSQSWLVSWSTAVGQDCLDLSYQEKGALPLAAVAVPILHKDDSIEVMDILNVSQKFYQRGHLYFYLPLPISHRLGFHINSQFTVSPDRKTLRVSCEDDKTTRMAKWNRCLFQDPITRATLCLMESLHDICPLKGYHFEQLWPVDCQVPSGELTVFDNMTQSFYREVVKPGQFEIFERNGKWFDISKCLFLDRVLLSSELGQYALECFSKKFDFAVDISSKAYDRLKHEDESLINSLTVSPEEFFLKYFFPNLADFSDNQKSQELVCYAIRMNTQAINSWIRKNKCIKNLGIGELKRPDELVDPNSSLAVLFRKTEYFPDEIFTRTRNGVLEELRKLGLMHTTLNDNLLLTLVDSVQKEEKRCSVCLSKLAGHLIMYVSRHLNSHEAIKKQLGQRKFIPVRKVPQNWSFEWSANLYKNPKPSKKCNEHKKDTIGDSVEFFECASKTVHSECQNILGTVSFIFENNVCHSLQGSDSGKALKALGMKYKQDVSWKSVLAHLDNVITTCNRQGLTNYDFTRGIMQDIYAFLEGTCSEHLESLSSKLLKRQCVYVSEQFVFPKVITKETLPVKCHPHLYQLDETILKSFPTLVKCMKITNAFSSHALALIVHNLKCLQGNNTLSEPEIHAVLNFLICLKAAMIREKSKTVIAVYGPDENGRLQDCKTMCFNDFDDIEKSDSMIFAHKMLPPEIAEFFGVLPKRLRFMEEHSEDIEDFYQNEPLVVRLRRILEGSPETGLFKELIQNADDAEATEVCFIRDYVYHNSEKDRDSEFEHALGPSLCIFNNSAFSKNDLEAITKLGQGNKADDSAKTGYYGIGFNAVYNLTDAPSFYTRGGDIEHGETLCYFDPLASFYPLVTREKPGKRIKNMKAIRSLSGDIMKSYHETFIPKGGKGTVFRLPLRTKGSEIKDEPITQESLDKLLESLTKELRDIVVFLKHLKCVRIVTNTGTGYKEDYRINLVMDGANTAVRDKIYRNFKDLGKVARESIFQYPQHTDLYTMSLHENEMKTGHGTRVTDFLVAMTVGFKKNAPFSEKLCNKFKKGKIKMIPFGGVAVGVKNKQNPKEILQRVSRSRDSRNPVFCFLPLPITTPLPVLVNGYFALDTETRQNLSGSGNTDEDRWRTHWNKLIIEKVISSAYIKLLDYTKNEIFGRTGITDKVRNPVLVHKAIGNFQEFFPVTDGLSEYWKMLACSVFRELIEEKIPFLPMQDTFANMFAQTRAPQCKLTWTSLYSSGCRYPAYVNGESVNHGTSEGNVRDNSKLNHLLRRAGMHIVYVNDKIIKSMEDTGKPILSLTPVNAIDFLCSWSKGAKDKCKIKPGENVLCTLQSVKETCTVLEFCLENVVHFLQNIMDIPLFVTETLQVLSLKDVEPRFVDKSGKYCTFFKSKTELFIHREIAALLEEKCGERMFECQKLRRFHLDDFVKLASLTKAVQTNCRTIVPWDGFNPSKEWISQFWEFFENELKARTHLANVVDGMKQIEMIPLIPATFEGNTTGFLVPYTDCNRIINLESFQSKHQLHTGLSKMNLHVMNKELFHDVNSMKNELLSVYDKLSEIIPNLQNPLGVLECLFLHIENISHPSISFEDTDAILHFFNEGLGNDGRLLNDELLGKLKKMPLFKSHFNKLVKLCDYEHIHVVPDELRPEGLEEIADQVNVLFLSNCHLKNLFKRLKISELAMADVYIKYIIPNQAKLRRASFYRHLEFLSASEYAHDDTNSGSNTLLTDLKNTKFVERTDHEFVKVDSLYDPYHPVFITMCDKNELVPKILRKQKLVKLFRKLGLHTEMTIELYERFATAIATQGIDNGLSSDVMKKSKLLVQHLLQMKDNFIKKVDFTNLSNIKFVLPGKVSEELSLMHSQFNVNTLIPFHGSVLSDRGGNENISWTVCNILPHFDSITSELVRRLKICEHPDIPTIIKHLTNVGKSVDDLIIRQLCTSAVQAKVSTVFHDIYQALSGHKNYTSHQWQKVDSPVIYSPEMKMVLPPKMVVLSCKVDAEDVPPYFCKCPNEYGMFHDLFVKLGANKQPECSSYSGVLHSMKTKQGETNEQLAGKDLEDATKATGYFLKLTSQSSGPIEVGADSLFLLSKQETLENAKSLIVSNNKFFEEQILKNGVAKSKFLAGLDLLSRFNLSTDSIVNCLSRLPKTHRPHLLTDIVHEQVILENIKNKDGKIAKHLESFIQGNHFIHGVLRLVCHVRKCQSKEFSEVERNKIIASLRKISCRHCSDIKTVIAMRSIENQQLGPFRHIKNTEEVRYVHLEKTEAGACIYFDTDDRQWVGSVQKSLTLYLNKEKGLGLLDEYQMRLEEIIALYRAPFNIDRHLSKHKVDDYPYQFEKTETPKVPIVGNYVPVELHQYLVNNFEDISESEYKFMALEIDDPFYYLDDDERCVQTFIYVHIIRKMQPISSLHLLQEYEIDDGSEQFKVVRAHKLYKITNRPTEWENPTDTTSTGNLDLKSVCKEIKDLLKDAWKQPVNERKSIVKRLLFKWHPDKNPDKVDFCTKVFQFIQQCIFALENGKELPNEENENENTGTRTPPPKSPGSFNSWSDGFWSRYRSRQQRPNREREERPNRERTEHGPNFGSFWTHNESRFRERRPYPCFLEARHWLAQAGYDLKDAKMRLRQPGTAFNWVCYQTYQAAEKALVAAWYAVDAYKADNKKYCKSLSFIASGLGPRLESLVARLESEVWSCRRMLYPSHYGIPQDLYNKDKAEKAIAISETIVKNVQESNNIL